MTVIDTKQMLFDLANTEAKQLQREQGREEKGIVSTQVKAVIIVVARLLEVMQRTDAIPEKPF